MMKPVRTAVLMMKTAIRKNPPLLPRFFRSRKRRIPVAENADEAEDSVNDIEKEAREFYNNHHAQSVEERVRSIHENAMNS